MMMPLKLSLLLLHLLLPGSWPKLNIFWSYKRGNTLPADPGVVCKGDHEEFLAAIVTTPYLCHQTKTTISYSRCISSIPCNNTKPHADKDDYQHAVVSPKKVDNSPLYCTSLDQIMCCLRTSQCPFTQPPEDRQISKGGCYVDEFYRARMAKYKPRGSKVPCSFPFIYGGITYHSCTIRLDPKCFRWCALLTYENGNYIDNSKLWGYCNSKCPYRPGIQYHPGLVNHKKQEAQTHRNRTTEYCYAPYSMKPMFKSDLPKLLDYNKKNNKHRGRGWDNQTSCSTDTIPQTWNPQSTDPSGGAVERHNTRCIFPFNYRGKWLSACTAQDDPDCRLWCSVENDNGFHRRQTSAWSHCSSNCPKTYSKTGVCEPPNKPHYLREEFPTQELKESNEDGYSLRDNQWEYDD